MPYCITQVLQQFRQVEDIEKFLEELHWIKTEIIFYDKMHILIEEW